MSWGFQFAAKSKQKAKDEVARIAAQPSSLTPEIASVIESRVDMIPDPKEDQVILVESNGHIDATPGYGYQSGNMTFRVTLIAALSILFILFAPSIARAEDPAPSPKFGGCVGPTCFGPSVSVSLVAMSLKTGDVTSTFDPGIGYGVTLHTDKWYKFGASASIAFPQFDGARRVQPAIVFSFAEFVRVGLACPLYVRGGFAENAQVLLAFGSDFGFSK
jgi:hypothetical protein